MAIAFDTFTSKDSFGAGVSPVTWSHTCTGTNLFLWVLATIDSSASVTGITYNGVSMTLAGSKVGNASMSTTTGYLFYLAGAASGSHTVSASITNAGAATASFVSMSYTGCAQTGTTFDVFAADNNVGNGNITSLTVSNTTTKNNDWLVGLFQNLQQTPAAGTNTTQRSNGQFLAVDSNAAQTPAGSHSLQATFTSSHIVFGLVGSMAPFVAPTSGFLMFM